jgi:hypothetical protein
MKIVKNFTNTVITNKQMIKDLLCNTSASVISAGTRAINNDFKQYAHFTRVTPVVIAKLRGDKTVACKFNTEDVFPIVLQVNAKTFETEFRFNVKVVDLDIKLMKDVRDSETPTTLYFIVSIRQKDMDFSPCTLTSVKKARSVIERIVNILNFPNMEADSVVHTPTGWKKEQYKTSTKESDMVIEQVTGYRVSNELVGSEAKMRQAVRRGMKPLLNQSYLEFGKNYNSFCKKYSEVFITTNNVLYSVAIVVHDTHSSDFEVSFNICNGKSLFEFTTNIINRLEKLRIKTEYSIYIKTLETKCVSTAKVKVRKDNKLFLQTFSKQAKHRAEANKFMNGMILRSTKQVNTATYANIRSPIYVRAKRELAIAIDLNTLQLIACRVNVLAAEETNVRILRIVDISDKLHQSESIYRIAKRHLTQLEKDMQFVLSKPSACDANIYNAPEQKPLKIRFADDNGMGEFLKDRIKLKVESTVNDKPFYSRKDRVKKLVDTLEYQIRRDDMSNLYFRHTISFANNDDVSTSNLVPSVIKEMRNFGYKDYFKTDFACIEPNNTTGNPRFFSVVIVQHNDDTADVNAVNFHTTILSHAELIKYISFELKNTTLLVRDISTVITKANKVFNIQEKTVGYVYLMCKGLSEAIASYDAKVSLSSSTMRCSVIIQACKENSDERTKKQREAIHSSKVTIKEIDKSTTLKLGPKVKIIPVNRGNKVRCQLKQITPITVHVVPDPVETGSYPMARQDCLQSDAFSDLIQKHDSAIAYRKFLESIKSSRTYITNLYQLGISGTPSQEELELLAKHETPKLIAALKYNELFDVTTSIIEYVYNEENNDYEQHLKICFN